jgi:hypothetical protein
MKTFSHKSHVSFINLDRIVMVMLFVGLVINYSCRRDDDNEYKINVPMIYSFNHSDFNGGIQCYDSLGNAIDYISPSFIRNDFLFYDSDRYPYEKIEINQDSTTLYYYTIRELLRVDSGILSIYHDTLYFYSGGTYFRLLFKGTIVNNQLRIPAYGYKLADIRNDIYMYNSSTSFGEPDMDEMLLYE